MAEKLFMQGNKALAEAAIRSGCLYFYGYPITPSSEIPEYFASQKNRGITYVQAESEVAAFNMLAGTAAAGKRVMTATSGPGFSLGQEAMSYMTAAHLPVVVVNIMRPGPADGEITVSQGDYFQATRGGGHGDYYNIVLSPWSIQEEVELTRLSFELAEKYKSPVVLLSDGKIAKMMESIDMPEALEKLPVTVDEPITGRRGDKVHFLSTCGDGTKDWAEKVHVLLDKFDKIKANEQRWESIMTDDADIIIVAFGIMARSARDVVKAARADGHKVGMIRPITLWPFPEKVFSSLDGKKFFVCELNAGMMVEDVKLSVKNKDDVSFFGKVGGDLASPEEIYESLRKQYGF